MWLWYKITWSLYNCRKDPYIICGTLKRSGFADFSYNSRVIDSYPLGGIGGTYGDMALPETAPNDPIFFIHRAFIDKIFYRWQEIYSEYANYDDSYMTEAVHKTDILSFFNVTLESTLDASSKLCYRYDK